LPFSKKTKIILAVVLLLGVIVVVFYAAQKEVVPPPLTVQEKKARFNSLIVPAVNNVYVDLMRQYEEVKKITDVGKSNSLIEKLKGEYKVTTTSDLLMALKPHPRSIAVAQAAMESSWATSRFFREANNAFGVWSFNEDEPRIAALKNVAIKPFG
jgi:Bax protein